MEISVPVPPAIQPYVTPGLSTLAAFILVFVWQRWRRGLSSAEALRMAILFARQIWDVSDFDAPRALGAGTLSMKQLREAGAVLLDQVVSHSTYFDRLPPEVAKPHPELREVDPVELARGVYMQVRGDSNGI
ncbi:hypothetical protein GS597_09100 [Synechococcales cyanobacterium C]|uniref:Uncharacterized protein n=1 Tax=Petrachloros mirabilis ULC683 TaxID=2781853 RepID=A0A8K1ZWW6_9CYAN|nr:hypothetical protein [Petrachloros mirabilis]NCJ06659.1 hypothetical protein [Petrachloros mirabilis ULC683]